MDRFIQMLGLQAVLLIYMLCGVLANRQGIVTHETQQKFVGLTLNIMMPCMVFNSFKSVTTSVLAEAAEVFFISLAMCLISWLAGRILYRRCAANEVPVLRYATLINNAGFAGLPLVQQAFGDTGLIYASVILIPIRFFMWSAGMTMLSGEKLPFAQVLKRLATNPNIVAVFLGLARGLLGITFPQPVETALSGLSSCVSPMSMIIIGSIISQVDPRTVVTPSVMWYCLVRLVLLPLVGLGLVHLLGAGEVMAGACVTITAMPAAATTALLSSRYGADEKYASKLVFVSTVLSLLTAPPLMLLL